ncbi:MAG TPA: AraC family transcriptional regulator, partial [Gemmatimonadaceae bacterium]|nr:AraC family transcriptional regulator [Gemmatimonadaceae bacterium]
MSRLSVLLDSLATREGTHPTSVPGVELARTSYSGRCPVMYEPMIYIMGQGRKRGFLGGEILRYDPDNYLVLSV